MFAELPFTHSKTEVVQLYIATKSPPFFMAEGNQNTTQVKRKKIKEKVKTEKLSLWPWSDPKFDTARNLFAPFLTQSPVMQRGKIQGAC